MARLLVFSTPTSNRMFMQFTKDTNFEEVKYFYCTIAHHFRQQDDHNNNDHPYNDNLQPCFFPQSVRLNEVHTFSSLHELLG